MFEGKKTLLFWIGLVILGLSLTGLFYLVLVGLGYLRPANLSEEAWEFWGGGFVFPAIFILLALLMITSGIKKKNKDAEPENSSTSHKN
jgi:hypothetical protein